MSNLSKTREQQLNLLKEHDLRLFQLLSDDFPHLVADVEHANKHEIEQYNSIVKSNITDYAILQQLLIDC